MGGQSPRPENIDNCEISYTYKFFPLTIIQIFAARIAQSLGITDLILTDSSACASSIKVLRDVQVMLEYEKYDRVVVLAVENGITRYMLDFFGETKTTLTLKDEEQGIKPSAFDSINHGFYLGHGAVLAVFEKEDLAEKNNPEAILQTACTVAEVSTNSAGQTKDGQGYQKSIERCLNQSNLTPNDISIIKSHGTGTTTNNTAERTAILNVFKDTKTVVTGYKQKIGHTLGVSGLLETCLLFDDLKNGFVPGFENRTEKDNIFLSEPISSPNTGSILTLASGMGNIFSAAIFKSLKVG
jgi:3-oxoacyl-(acyl-carrier-protein) synthase